ncbi:MAG: DNA-3-methyladenine glycosylase family protein [Candidatus Thorarchaeota archaeon]
MILREEIIKTLQKDPVMKKILANAKKEVMVKESTDDCFQSLYETIIYQQLSGKAASSILRKFLTLFPEGKVTPKDVLAKSEEELASAGISRQKRGYLYSLAEKFLDGTITPEKFGSMSDEEIITELVQIKGIGPWSAQMYLMFTLGREDVFAPDDLGLRKAIQVNYNLTELPKPKEAEKIAEQWKPYRTWASLLLWKSIEG